MTRGQVSYTAADDTHSIFGLGIDETDADALATQAELDAAVAAIPGSFGATLTVTTLDGADETTPPGEIYAVTGMAATALVRAVLFVSTKAAVATIEVLDPATFVPGAATLTSTTEVDRTNDQLIVIWFDI